MPVTSDLESLRLRVVAAQDEHPRELGFVLAMIPDEEEEYLEPLHKRYGTSIEPGPRFVAFCSFSDPRTTDNWECWLLKGAASEPTPVKAFRRFNSLADAALELVVNYPSSNRGNWLGLLHVAVEACPKKFVKREWDAAGVIGGREFVRWAVTAAADPRSGVKITRSARYHRTSSTKATGKPDKSRRWLVEGPCVFEAVANALASLLEQAHSHAQPKDARWSDYLTGAKWRSIFRLPHQEVAGRLDELAKQGKAQRRSRQAVRVDLSILDPNQLGRYEKAVAEFD